MVPFCKQKDDIVSTDDLIGICVALYKGVDIIGA
jgi:hypothetical protein